MDNRQQRLGTVSLSPSGPVVAGSIGQWVLTYCVGSYGVDEGGTIKIARRFASDWQRPQFDQPTQLGYTTATTTGDAKLATRWDPKGHVRPWMKCLVIDVYDGSLAPGDLVTVTFGDQSQGSPGIRAQTFQESAHEIRVLVDPTNACLVRRLPSSPVLSVVAGSTERIVVVLPTQAVVGQNVELFARGEDAWGNPTPLPDAVAFNWSGDPIATVHENSQIQFIAEGNGRIVAQWNGKQFTSNSITSHLKAPKYHKYWGDLHAQTDATVGTGTETEYFTFGRDQAALDFTSHQGNDFQVTDEDWRQLNEVVQQFHEDDRFVVFPGYEWSANTTAGGDRNVVYLEEGMPIIRSSHWQVDSIQEDDLTPAHPADVFFQKLRESVDPNKVLVISHVGGRYADIRSYFDQQLAPLVEVVSCWGVFEWMLWDAFDKGFVVGVVCNSDGHKGRPGAEGPGAGEFGIASGLTCVLAESLTRESVFAALRRRRCYGTTGPRMDLSFSVNDQPMGSCLEDPSSPVQVAATVRTSAPLESLMLFRGRNIECTVRPDEFDDCGSSRRIRLMWRGARIRGRGRRAVWDGTVEVSGTRIASCSPVSFDSPADHAVQVDSQTVRFRSRTTGDADGLDLLLDQGHVGTVTLKSAMGELRANLEELDQQGVYADYGGIDLRASIQRYPEELNSYCLQLNRELAVHAAGTTPLFVKAVQEDGHMAWASPIYIKMRER